MSERNVVGQGNSAIESNYKDDEKIGSGENKTGKSTESISFPIIGIGASAGGLEALEKFFGSMPSDCGMAFVIVQHSDPAHKSILGDLLRRYTHITVTEVMDGVSLEANTIYIAPPNLYTGIFHGAFILSPAVSSQVLHWYIDYFFRSLATDQKDQAIGIILSGTGSDGTVGLKSIKGESGLVIVQDPRSSKYDGMPRSAINTGLVDFVLPPDKMPKELISYTNRLPDIKIQEDNINQNLPPSEDLKKIIFLLRSKTDVDFTSYKTNTILRRIERRLNLNQITNISDYLRYLQQNPREIDVLFRDFLIGVTNFFRDKEAFDSLQQKVIPLLFENRPSNSPVRVWIPACSTGEEAYSIAILFRNYLESHQMERTIQFFATDLDEQSINKARIGIYPESIGIDVSPELLGEYFTLEENNYHIKKNIRDMITFSTQNIISDPPFSRLDFICCRNLFIYLHLESQKRILHIFHYSLKDQGFLFLGSSETIGQYSNFFSIIDQKWKIFQKISIANVKRGILDFPTLKYQALFSQKIESKDYIAAKKFNFREMVENILLEKFAPTCVLINERGEILYFHGKTGKYLEPTTGEANLDILKMAKEELKLELATGIRKALNLKQELQLNHLKIKVEKDFQIINLRLIPIIIPQVVQTLMLVVFEEIVSLKENQRDEEENKSSDEYSQQRMKNLEQELNYTRDHLQSVLEALETTNKELKSANEELQSLNEEVQCSNEELETSREELQSTNEELTITNSELQKRIEDLSQTNNDMNNLLASTDIGTIFLDTSLIILRFTPAITQIINLIPSDVGRPISHIVSNLTYENLVKDSEEVLKTLVPHEQVVQNKKGKWFSMRILPYRTMENVVEGVVVTFVDITAQKNAEQEVQASNIYAEGIINTLWEPLIVLGENLEVISANEAFFRVFHLEKQRVIGTVFYNLLKKEWNISQLKELLEGILSEKKVINDLELTQAFGSGEIHRILLNARQLQWEGRGQLILIAMEDLAHK